MDTSYPLEVQEKGSVDKKLIGTWTTDAADSDAKKVTITMNEDKTYKVEVLAKGEYYAAETDIFKAWLTSLNKRKFIVLQEMYNGEGKQAYYVYDITIGDKTFTARTISVKGKGIDSLLSVKDYRDRVKSSMDSSDFLSTDMVWNKAE
jgi:hypothetical protein